MTNTENESGKTVDFLGQEIILGDQLVYPVRRQSVMFLRTATVSEPPNEHTHLVGVACINDTGRRIMLKHTERCVVVSKLEVKPDVL